MTTIFTRVTAAVSVAVGNVSGDSVHIIPLDVYNSPPVTTFYTLVTRQLTSDVSARVAFTLDSPLTNSSPSWFDFYVVANATPATVRSITFPIAGMMWSINVSGSANYAIGLVQTGHYP